MDAILKEIFKFAENRDAKAYSDALAYMRESKKINDIRQFRQICRKQIKQNPTQEVLDALRLSYFVAAPFDFDSYMVYMEIDRKPEERFWLPRKTILKPLADNLQDLADGKLDELFISQPPRTGKTSLTKFFTTYHMGKKPNNPNLYCSYSDIITTSYYNGIMELLTDNVTYKFDEIFPNSPIARTNAKDETIDLARKKSFPTLTARSIYGTLNGACDAEGGLIISDDLVSGIEEAMNKDRMISLWQKVDNNLLTRGKQSTKLLWVGTRWAQGDPIGVRLDILENDPKFKNRKWKVINVPALDDNDQSNFNYAYGVGFDTEYYHQRRASFERNNDLASWDAQYMGTPYDRSGSVFCPDDFEYYNGELPQGDPDRVFIAVDPAFGGGDFTAAPVCIQYEERIFVADAIFDNAEKNITQPKIAELVKKYGVRAVKVEGTKTTRSYGEELDDLLRKRGIRVNMQIDTKHWTGTGKEQRIFDHAPSIREHFVFLASGYRSKEYEMYMQNVFAFKIVGKNKNDDAPDSLCIADDFAFYNSPGTITVLKCRPF